MIDDYKSGLPVRSEADSTDERVHVKIVDYDDPSGAGKQAQVDADGNVHTEVHGNRADDAADIPLLLSELGRPNPDGIYHADDNSKPAHVGLVAAERATTPGDAEQTFRPTGIQGTVDDEVHALDTALHDEAGNPYSEANPLPVSVVDSEGTEINDYMESVANVAAGGNDVHTLVAAADMKLTQLHMTASGRAKFLVEVDPTGAPAYAKKFIFFNSTAKPDCDITLKEPIAVAATGHVKITRYNLDNQPMALYSTISGHTVTP